MRSVSCGKQWFHSIACAMTGIASLLLEGGTTTHSRFGVPLRFDDKEPRSTLRLQDDRAKVLRDADLIVIDVQAQFFVLFGCVMLHISVVYCSGAA